MKKKVTLLLLTCGTNACYHVAKRLKERFADRIRIVGSDINHPWMIPTQPYLDAFYQCPLTSSESYYSFILGICSKENIDYLLPSFDADQMLFHQGNEDLKKRSIVSLGITEDATNIYQSKEDTNSFLKQHHLPVPRFYQPKDIEDNCEYFCKPRHGVGSAGVKKLTGCEIKNVNDSDLIIEEICQEPEITLECFNYKGKVYSVARERLGTKAGVCTKARVFYDKELEIIGQHFADSIELPYIFNLQFMTNTEGRKVITDVNLRSAGGMSLSYAAGWDEAEALGKIMMGEEGVTTTLKPLENDVYVMRAYTDVVTKRVEHHIAFDLDGTLLDSRKRHQAVMDDVLRELNVELDTSDLLDFKSEGHNNKEWLRQKGIKEDLAELINKRWVELIEEEKYLDEDTLYPGVYECLSNLSTKNSLYLVTARNNHENAERQITKLGIRGFFDEIAVVPSSKTTSEDKAQRLKAYNAVVFYGDTESDMKAAGIAGCDFKAVVNGFRSEQFWKNYQVEIAEIK